MHLLASEGNIGLVIVEFLGFILLVIIGFGLLIASLTWSLRQDEREQEQQRRKSEEPSTPSKRFRSTTSFLLCETATFAGLGGAFWLRGSPKIGGYCFVLALVFALWWFARTDPVTRALKWLSEEVFRVGP